MSALAQTVHISDPGFIALPNEDFLFVNVQLLAILLIWKFQLVEAYIQI